MWIVLKVFRWCESYYIRYKYCIMFILIFGLILTSPVLKKLWQKRHIWLIIYPSTSVSRRYYYIDKRCTKMGAWKITKKPIEKKVLVLYNISKDWSSKLGSPKSETLTHITIYNPVFSTVCSCCMTSSVQMPALHLYLNCICNKLGLCLVLHLVNTQKLQN